MKTNMFSAAVDSVDQYFCVILMCLCPSSSQIWASPMPSGSIV